MEILTFHLEDFDGPLDLLLHLIHKNKMDLHNIPILELIDQYTAVINTLQQDRLEVASEFIEMAAQLVQMKSILLLPRSEEAQRIKAELQGQLIEYDLCKQIAARMRLMQEGTFRMVREPQEVEPDRTYRLHHSPLELEKAWNNLMGRSVRKQEPQPERFEPLVTAPFVSVASRVVHLLRNLKIGRFHRLGELFRDSRSRSETVATFLAVLELVRAGRMTIEPDESLKVNRGKHPRQEETES